MSYKLYILLQVVWTITPIWAAFKDFVIENERDLERFGVPNGEMMYEDEDLEYDESFGAVGDSCGSYGDMSRGYDIFHSFDEENDYAGVSMPGQNEGNIDGAILKEVIRQLANDPRFQHLKEYLTEDKLLLDYDDGRYNEEIPAPNYVDYFEDERNYIFGDQ